MKLEDLLEQAKNRSLIVAADGQLTEDILKDALKAADEIDAFCSTDVRFAATRVRGSE